MGLKGQSSGSRWGSRGDLEVIVERAQEVLCGKQQSWVGEQGSWARDTGEAQVSHMGVGGVAGLARRGKDSSLSAHSTMRYKAWMLGNLVQARSAQAGQDLGGKADNGQG